MNSWRDDRRWSVARPRAAHAEQPRLAPATLLDRADAIENPFAIKVSDYVNAAYDLLVPLLARFFAYSEQNDDDLTTLAQTAIGGMFLVMLPQGDLFTRLPMGPSHPGKLAGSAFCPYRQTADLLPHRRVAWLLVHERLAELAAYGDRLRPALPTAPQIESAAQGVRAALRRLTDPDGI